MDITRRNFPEIGQPGGPFCHAVRAGNMLYISGATAGGSEAAHGTAAQQAEAILKKLSHILQAEGATLANVVKVTVFLTDMGSGPRSLKCGSNISRACIRPAPWCRWRPWRPPI